MNRTPTVEIAAYKKGTGFTFIWHEMREDKKDRHPFILFPPAGAFGGADVQVEEVLFLIKPDAGKIYILAYF